MYVRAVKNDVKIAQTLTRLWASPLTAPSQPDVCSAVMAFFRSNLRHRPYQQRAGVRELRRVETLAAHQSTPLLLQHLLDPSPHRAHRLPHGLEVLVAAIEHHRSSLSR